MKLKFLIGLLLFNLVVQAQKNPYNNYKQEKWRIDRNKWITGSLVFTAGASKGFNETLLFHWKAFRHRFPNANAQWFNPNISWRNKYKDGAP